MNGRKKRKAHHNILLLPEIVACRVVVIGTTTSNRCKSPNTTRNPINALFMCASSCSHNASHQRQSTRVAGNLSDCMRLLCTRCLVISTITIRVTQYHLFGINPGGIDLQMLKYTNLLPYPWPIGFYAKTSVMILLMGHS